MAKNTYKKGTSPAQDKNKKRKKNSERNIENPLKPAPDIVYNRIKSFFIGSGKELKGGIPEEDTKL